MGWLADRWDGLKATVSSFFSDGNLDKLSFSRLTGSAGFAVVLFHISWMTVQHPKVPINWQGAAAFVVAAVLPYFANSWRNKGADGQP